MGSVPIATLKTYPIWSFYMNKKYETKAVDPTQLAKQEQVDLAPITLDQLKKIMPKRQKHNVNQDLVDKLNNLAGDIEERRMFRENLLSYTHVLQDPHVRMDSYIDAVKYVSFKLMGHTNQEAWIKTFPHRYQRLLDDGKSDMFMRATVSGYNKNKIVNTVYEQALIPVHVMNADVFQKAVSTQAELMINPNVSDKVRSDAANSLMTHLKPPEARKLQLDVAVAEDDSLRDLRHAITDLAKAQKDAIEVGTEDAKKIAEAKIIPGDSERIE